MSIAQPTCPVCGGVIHEDGRVLVDFDGGYVAAGEAVARLTHAEMGMFSALWRNRPRAIDRELLLAMSAEGEGDDRRDPKLVGVVISIMRGKLSPLNITIETIATGYRIINPKQAALAA